MLSPSADAAVLQRRLFRFALTASGPLALAGAAALGGAGATVGQMLVAAHLVVSAFAPSAAESSSRALAWLAFFIALRAACAGLSEWAGQRLATRLKSRLRRQLVEAPTRGSGPREPTGEVVTRAVEGIEKLDGFYRRFVPQLLATAAVPIVILTAVARLDPLSAAVLALTGPIIPVFMWLLGTMAERRARDQWQALTLLGVRFLDTLQGLPTLAIVRRARDAAARLDEASEQLRVRTMAVLRVAFLSGFVLELAASVSTAMVAVGVGVRLIEGWLAFEPGLAVLLLAPEFYLPFRLLGQRHHAAMEALAALGDCPQISGDGHNMQGGRTRPTTGGGLVVGPVPNSECSLTLDRVSFTYPNRSVPALQDVTLALPPRTLTALVGPSGAGKSTLVALLLRLREPTAGAMRLNGQPHQSVGPTTWRRHFALVPQRPRFIDGSVLENLRIGRPDAPFDDVVAVARLARADAFISRLPNGYATALDETASTLSGGERQRLAIARALLKQTPVLVLDEPTSSLDAQTESHIADLLTEIARKRTVLVIAHRPQTVRRADRLVILQAGRVVEVGTCAQLSRTGRLYKELFGSSIPEVA